MDPAQPATATPVIVIVIASLQTTTPVSLVWIDLLVCLCAFSLTVEQHLRLLRLLPMAQLTTSRFPGYVDPWQHAQNVVRVCTNQLDLREIGQQFE